MRIRTAIAALLLFSSIACADEIMLRGPSKASSGCIEAPSPEQLHSRPKSTSSNRGVRLGHSPALAQHRAPLLRVLGPSHQFCAGCVRQACSCSGSYPMDTWEHYREYSRFALTIGNFPKYGPGHHVAQGSTSSRCQCLRFLAQDEGEKRASITRRYLNESIRRREDICQDCSWRRCHHDEFRKGHALVLCQLAG